MQNPFYDFKENKLRLLEVQLGVLNHLLDYDVDNYSDLMEQIKNASFGLLIKPLAELLSDQHKEAYTSVKDMVNLDDLNGIESGIADDIVRIAGEKGINFYGNSKKASASFERIVVHLLFSYASGHVLIQETKARRYTAESKLIPVYDINVKTYINNNQWLVHTIGGEVDQLTPTLLNNNAIEYDKYGFTSSMQAVIESMSTLKAKGCIDFSSCDELMDIEGLVLKAERMSKILGGTAKDHIQIAQSMNSGSIRKKDAIEWLQLHFNCSVSSSQATSVVFQDRLID